MLSPADYIIIYCHMNYDTWSICLNNIVVIWVCVTCWKSFCFFCIVVCQYSVGSASTFDVKFQPHSSEISLFWFWHFMKTCNISIRLWDNTVQRNFTGSVKTSNTAFTFFEASLWLKTAKIDAKDTQKWNMQK